MQIRKNAVKESVQDKTISVLYIEGKQNMADLFTKEMKDVQHFIKIQNLLMSGPKNRGAWNEEIQQGTKGVSSWE